MAAEGADQHLGHRGAADPAEAEAAVPELSEMALSRAIEAAGLGLAIVATSGIVFIGASPFSDSRTPSEFLTMPLLMCSSGTTSVTLVSADTCVAHLSSPAQLHQVISALPVEHGARIALEIGPSAGLRRVVEKLRRHHDLL